MLKNNRIAIFCLLTLFILSLETRAQKRMTTSNEAIAKSYLLQIDSLNERNNWDTIVIIAKKLFQFSEKTKSAYYKGKSSFYIARSFSRLNEKDSAFVYFKTAEKAYEVCNDTLNRGIINAYLGYEYKNLGNIDSAISYYIKGSDFLELIEDTIWFGYTNNHLGMIYFNLGNYLQALQHLQISKEMAIKSNNTLNVGKISNAIGIIYRKTKDREKEEAAYQFAIQTLETIDNSMDLGMAYNNISEVYLDKGEIDKGFEALSKAKEIYEEIDYPLGLCSYYAVLSYYYLETADPPVYKKVIEYCLKSLAIAEKFEDYRQYADVTSYLGTAYLKTNQLGKAQAILEKGLIVAEENKFKHEIVKIKEALALVYEKKNQPFKALQNLKDYVAIKDSIIGEEKIKEFTRLDMEFKFKQQQVSDSLKYVQENLETEFLHKRELQMQKLSILILIFISLLIITISVFIYINSRKNKKQVGILSEKNTQINLQKKEIENYAKQVREAYLKLKELDEYKEAMTNMLVHDLKNPLNLLVNLDAFSDEYDKSLIINRTSKQMLNLIMNLLDISKVEHNTMQLNKTKIQLLPFLHLAIEEVDFLCLQKNIKLQIISEDNLNINADRDIFLRVINNLLVNAIKFSPSKSTISIISQIIDEENKLRISIKDEGIGIASENHNLIFEKFKHVQQINTNQIGSTGLGLTFCKMAVESHGWEIGLESELGKGAEFFILIKDFEKA
jgi:signal transduction histidine kinase